jgi:membrane protein CcdC involved in cytochrome C biogenesis
LPNFIKKTFSFKMYLIPIAWLYVAIMMALAEATNPQGTLLGAFFTLLLYGLLPLGILMYVLGGPARKRAKKESEAQAQAQTHAHSPSAAQPNEGAEAAAGTETSGIAPVREK